MYEKLLEIQKLNLSFKKDGKNPFFKSNYLTLEHLWQVLKPEVSKLGISVYHTTQNREVCTIITDGNEELKSCMPLPENLDPQKLGSAVTYYKRYNLGQLFNIMTDQDDDGNATVGKKKVENKSDEELPF